MRQWWPSASSSRSPMPRRERRAAPRSSAQPLVEVVDVQQRGVAALERDELRARVAEPVGHLQRLAR